MSAPYMKIVPPLSEYSLVCRGCLADSGEMKNIREWGMVDDFYHITNVQCKLDGTNYQNVALRATSCFTDTMPFIIYSSSAHFLMRRWFQMFLSSLKHTDGISELLCTSCEDTLRMCKRFKTQCQQSDITLKNIAQNQISENEDESNQNIITLSFNENSLTYNITAPNMEAKIHLTCPYKCINSHFIKKRDLLTHLTKQHVVDKNFTIDTKYFCNVKDCQYNKNKEKKYFTERKFLNQHFIKVHKSKNFRCDVCDTDFVTVTDFNRHLKSCNVDFNCDICNIKYKTNERLLVHLMRHHPALHEEYKAARKAEKRKLKSDVDAKKIRTENINDYLMDSPKRSFATQTLDPLNTVKNDVTLPSWQTPSKTDEISTQTVFEDLLSLKSQNSEDDSIFFSETVSLSDIQTQTFPEFGLNRSNKETLTDNQVDSSIKATQTCFCYCESPKFPKICDSVSSSPNNLTSTETQTAELKSNVKSDVMLSFSSAETQTCFDDDGF